ncbi:beta-ketoacyl-ACP synthase II [Mucilaginibacter rubeus]|uniref:3-oxoacyl-[acyl-carrier-protein] synthase 2 n=1 Tax=Mucilaginibacter rubeus TaxID=2027860 RepID=A0AAE6JFH9_9SPHI|nr:MULTISPECIES: beta-ketoacyl-ACP synthase II [Mucilaginibacter]QEM04724.1 beta-ketoacyl-ACP synthase II [Mucilaginibacter rubeus]QEM17318.1 beta-ketoacyl-ACP synthase II [Mucilaginibacter gossypii]QTE46168.1 beta-ketoacyl-ACP synthase II [Mucilaginibacter rubeus]QTE52766.1 beta-ketoacyl-ACP synthase II [Mucilaginibacter rubeus]QTE57853.1 beta-ketoacyl-ACP synthase II [Mucilaginibacter rubeus]
MLNRVVITGLGALTPLGNNVKTYWQNLIAGKSGAATITRFDASLFRTQFACELKDFNITDHLDKAELKRTDTFTQYALVAADEAIKDSGFDLSKMDPFDVGIIWGSGQGGMETFEEQVTEYARGNGQPRFSPFFVPKFISNMASGMISIRNGFMGINYTTVSACATSNTAIMDAFNYIRLGKAKIIVTGGSEAPITPASIGGFSSMKAMSARNNDPQHASRPFDIDRDGFVMGEGAGALVLEDYDHAVARGAHIYAEVTGASMTADAYHMTATHPEGLGAARAMQQALTESGLSIEDVDYLNMHATSTPVGDLSEINALLAVTKGKVTDTIIGSTKSMTGHLLGAAGAIEAIAAIKSIENQVIPPTINTTTLDPAIPDNLKFVLNDAINHKVKVAMSNTFGFGGHNGIVVFKAV